MWRPGFLVPLASIVLTSVAFGGAPSSGPRIADFRLRDSLGAPHALRDFQKSRLVVVAFLGADCPLANRYASRLVELHRRYGPRGVAFLGIDSNQQDSLAQLTRFADRHKLTFPLLKDPGNVVADRFDAQRTPQVFVLDGQRLVRYRGRVDDQFGIGYHRPAPKHRDLETALDELLAGQAVSQPVTQASGCRIGRVERHTPHGPITYTKQIARLLQQHCASCHRAGGIAPFALTSYRDVAGWAETIKEVVQDGRMPPWDANPKIGTFTNDPSLTDAEKHLLDTWVANGTPEGDLKDLPPPARFVEGWRIPKPDLIVRMPRTFQVPARGQVPYQYFIVDPGFKEDTWIQASEVRPGNPAVVHHVVVFVQPPGKSSAAARDGIANPVALGVPGTGPMIFPTGVARLVPAGSTLIFQMHYTPNGLAQSDRTAVGFVFAKPGQVRKAIRAEMAINRSLHIPAHDADYQATVEYRFRQDMLLYALYPHMHLRGKSFRFVARYPNGRSEVLLDVPRYRFDWQIRYVLTQPRRMPEGTVLHCEAHFDNSEENLSNPNPNVAVSFGEQTWDEMLVGYFDMALADQDLTNALPRVKRLGVDRYEAVFHYRAPAGTKAVYLAGDFNDWKPTALKMAGPDQAGQFTTRVELKPGRHEYKFVLDGKTWRHDPANPQQAGFYNNSVLLVRPKG